MTEFFSIWQDVHWQAAWVLLLVVLWPMVRWLRQQSQARWPWLAEPATQAQPVFYHSKIAAFMATRGDQPVQSPGLIRWLMPLQTLLRTLLVILVLLALAGPIYWQALPQQVRQAEPIRDVTLVVESSVSLLLEDYAENDQPLSRVAVLQQVLDEFVAAMPQHRFSIILYADQAFTLMPMTADRNTVRAELPRLLPYLAGRTDQAMGEAMVLAIRTMLADTQRPKDYDPLLVVVSDGLQARSRLSLADVIEYAGLNDIAIHTIGLGGQQDLSTRSSGLIYQPLETASLQTLAADTGGQFVAVFDPNALRQAFAQLQLRAPEGVVEQGEQWRAVSLAHWPLMLALGVAGLLLLIHVLTHYPLRGWRRGHQ